MMDSIQSWFDRLVGVQSAQAHQPKGMDAYAQAVNPRTELEVPACWRRAPKVTLQDQKNKH